jgi:hypothetical protein
MTIFNTTITQMYTLQTPDPDYIVNVIWQVEGVDGAYTALIGGNTQFNSADQVGPVIPYADLTESVVLSWIPESAIASAQACVQGQIDSMITPPVSPANTALPWSQA